MSPMCDGGGSVEWGGGGGVLAYTLVVGGMSFNDWLLRWSWVACHSMIGLYAGRGWHAIQ